MNLKTKYNLKQQVYILFMTYDYADDLNFVNVRRVTNKRWTISEPKTIKSINVNVSDKTLINYIIDESMQISEDLIFETIEDAQQECSRRNNEK